ncbi:hypothetical protein Tco_1027400 [Tanacetum coccineum]
MSYFVESSSATMYLPLLSTIFGGGVRENSDELKLNRVDVYCSNVMLSMITGGLMPYGITDFRGVGVGIVKSGTYSGILNFTFLTGGSSSEISWKSTRRTFTIDGNTYPLTRITSSKVVPLKETISKSVITQNLEIKVSSKRAKVTKSVGSSCKSKIANSGISKKSKPIQSWGSNASNVPSNSLVNFKLSNFFSGIWNPDASST